MSGLPVKKVRQLSILEFSFAAKESQMTSNDMAVKSHHHQWTKL